MSPLLELLYIISIQIPALPPMSLYLSLGPWDFCGPQSAFSLDEDGLRFLDAQ